MHVHTRSCDATATAGGRLRDSLPLAACKAFGPTCDGGDVGPFLPALDHQALALHINVGSSQIVAGFGSAPLSKQRLALPLLSHSILSDMHKVKSGIHQQLAIQGTRPEMTKGPVYTPAAGNTTNRARGREQPEVAPRAPLTPHTPANGHDQLAFRHFPGMCGALDHPGGRQDKRHQQTALNRAAGSFD